MPRKVEAPPKAVFKNRKIKVSPFEKPKTGLNRIWLEELNTVERRMKTFISMDITRLKKACDSAELERLCRVLGLAVPRGEEGPDMNFSLHDVLEDEPEMVPKLKRISKDKSRADDSFSKESSEVLAEDPSSTLFQSVLQRASGRKIHDSPYRLPLSEESIESSEDTQPSTPPSSEEKSLETTKALSEDLFVHPAASQNTELLEPLEEARSPYQRFFSRSPKEVRRHVERLRKKRFHSASEKCIEELVQFLEEKKIRSEKITFQTVSNLFKVEIDKPPEHAFLLDPRELPAVPKEVADLYQDPNSSVRAALHKQIMWDMIYEEGRGKDRQFGRAPRKPKDQGTKDTRNRWFAPPGVDWDLLTGRDFWVEFLHTEILEGFGKWLLDNPRYDRPEYLVQIGFFDYLENKLLNQSESVKVPVQSEEELTDLVSALLEPLQLDKDDLQFEQLPRYQEIKEAALHPHLTSEGLEHFYP